MGWLAEEVHDLDPQYCRPGEPAIANHQTHNEVNKELSRRLGASGARNEKSQKKEGNTC